VIRTPLTELLGIRYPVVQAAMGYVSGPRLAAATSNAGGLGLIASATMSLAELEAAIAETAGRTSAPFGVNLRADAPDAGERVKLIVAGRVPVASFAQAPKPELIAALKEAGVVTIASAGARRHAEKAAAWGIDAVIATGSEGGGHVGAVPAGLLIPQVAAAVDVPVIAAGGFFDGRGLVAALAWGAAGIAMGTRFLLTSDSPVPEAVKRLYLAAGLDGTVVTAQVDGVPHRVLRTRMVDRLVSSEGAVGAGDTAVLLRAAMVDGRTDLGLMPAGQVTGLIEDLPSCEDLIAAIMRDAEAGLERIATFRSEKKDLLVRTGRAACVQVTLDGWAVGKVLGMLEEFLAGGQVDAAVSALRPDYRAMLLAVGGLLPGPSDQASDALLRAAEAAAGLALRGRPAEELPHVAAWREAYRAFGAKPQRTRNSLEALLRRAASGLPRVNRLTDTYNAVSVLHQVPVGGEDLTRYTGAPRLVRATGTEPFDTVADGVAVIEHPDPGEVVWCDEAGVTCRRWNWRQARRTQLRDHTTAALFILDALDPMTDEALQAAADDLVSHLARLGPDVRDVRRLIVTSAR
jgi:NAD(P)H-dependent flavin oxidoreductase YrpB (nitropropane dioxygenase family)/DNA/RNA-binding domain of Phe-tRNA-synthetase-like protein